MIKREDWHDLENSLVNNFKLGQFSFDGTFFKSFEPTPATFDLGECQKVIRIDICSSDIGNPWLWTFSDIDTHVWLKKCNISILPSAWIWKAKKRVPQSHQGTKHTSRHQEHWESFSFHLQSLLKTIKAKVVQKMMGQSWHPKPSHSFPLAASLSLVLARGSQGTEGL
jgi:hypothetical protein